MCLLYETYQGRLVICSYKNIDVEVNVSLKIRINLVEKHKDVLQQSWSEIMIQQQQKLKIQGIWRLI